MSERRLSVDHTRAQARVVAKPSKCSTLKLPRNGDLGSVRLAPGGSSATRRMLAVYEGRTEKAAYRWQFAQSSTRGARRNRLDWRERIRRIPSRRQRSSRCGNNHPSSVRRSRMSGTMALIIREAVRCDSLGSSDRRNRLSYQNQKHGSGNFVGRSSSGQSGSRCQRPKRCHLPSFTKRPGPKAT